MIILTTELPKKERKKERRKEGKKERKNSPPLISKHAMLKLQSVKFSYVDGTTQKLDFKEGTETVVTALQKVIHDIQNIQNIDTRHKLHPLEYDVKPVDAGVNSSQSEEDTFDEGHTVTQVKPRVVGVIHKAPTTPKCRAIVGTTRIPCKNNAHPDCKNLTCKIHKKQLLSIEEQVSGAVPPIATESVECGLPTVPERYMPGGTVLRCHGFCQKKHQGDADRQCSNRANPSHGVYCGKHVPKANVQK